MQRRQFVRLTADLNHPLYLYQREVNSLPLLDKEQASTLYQAIERHLKDILWICTAVPESLDLIHAHFKKVTTGELKLETLLHGFNSPDLRQLKPDLAQVQQQLFTLLIYQYATQDKLSTLGITSPETQASRQQLLEGLSHFKWTTQVLDKLAKYFQSLEHKQDCFKQKFHQALTAFKQAKHSLISSNLRLVFFVARKYSRLGVPFLDLIQEGNIGLIQAVERFDTHWGYAFSSYATIWIKHAILNAVSKFQSLPIEKDEILESVEDENIPRSIDVIFAEDLCTATHQALSHLPPREADILRLRFGIGYSYSRTLEEVGEVFNVSRERIRQIEAKALKALRDQTKLHSLNPFLKD